MNALRDRASRSDGLAQLRHEQLAETIHSLRSPLLSVIGYARLLLKERAGPISETQREYLTAITDNATAMNNALRGASRASDATTTQDLQWFDLRVLWRSLLRAELRDARLPDGPCRLFGDPNKLAAALEAVLSTVRAWSSPGGRLKAESSQREGRFLVRFSLSEEDTSVGSAPWALPAAAQDAIRMHGGSVRPEETPETGRRVVVTLPVFQPTTQERTVESDEEVRGSGGG